LKELDVVGGERESTESVKIWIRRIRFRGERRRKAGARKKEEQMTQIRRRKQDGKIKRREVSLNKN